MLAVDLELRSLRVARRLSLGMAAALAGVGKTTLLAWENGTNRPRGPALARLLDALEAEPRLRARLLQAADPAFARVELIRSPLGAPVGVGTVLRAMRERRGVTQADLARRVGVTQGAVSQWELGEAVPSTEMAHAVGFALGASVEETLALASARGEDAAGLPEDLEAAHLRFQTPSLGPLQEFLYLGWEAELWRRAARDPRWDAGLVRVLAARANWLVGQERLDEAAVLARRALGMARTAEERTFAVPAVAVLADHDRRSGRGHAESAERAGAWAARLPDSTYRAWMLHQRGICLARMGRGDEGAAVIEQGSDVMRRLEPENYVHPVDLASRLCEARLAAGESAKAAALAGECRECGFSAELYVRIEHSLGRAATDADMAYLRFWIGANYWDPQHRRRLERIERRQAKLTGGKPAPIVSYPLDVAMRDRLWAAVLRDNPG